MNVKADKHVIDDLPSSAEGADARMAATRTGKCRVRLEQMAAKGVDEGPLERAQRNDSRARRINDSGRTLQTSTTNPSGSRGWRTTTRRTHHERFRSCLA